MYEIRETLGDCCRQKGLGVLGDYGADLGIYIQGIPSVRTLVASFVDLV